MEVEVNNLRQEKEKAMWGNKELVNTLQKERKYLNQKISQLEDRLKLGLREKPSSLTEGICDAIDALITNFYKRTGPKK